MVRAEPGAGALGHRLAKRTHSAGEGAGWTRERVLPKVPLGQPKARSKSPFTHHFLHCGSPPRTKTQGLPPTGHFCFHGAFAAPGPLADGVWGDGRGMCSGRIHICVSTQKLPAEPF